MSQRSCLLLAGGLMLSALAVAQTGPDLKRQPTLYVVPYAHLDTQWNWDLRTTIREYLPKTMKVNFDFFEKYPHYLFNFSGANRYRLMKEYYPSDYQRIQKYVAAGRWFPAGSSMEEGDVNAPSAESIFRQILLGNAYFRREFGKASAEYMLPDCFGFPASLPSILAHAGIKGFSTQKLSSMWQPAPRVGGPDSPEKTPEGIPFNVGIWEGPDGKTVMAALNPLAYTSSVDYDLSKTPPALPQPATPPPSATAGGRGGRGGFGGFGPRSLEDWPKRIQINGGLTGIFADYHYVGTGDTGGGPTEASVKLLEAIVTKGTTVLPTPGSGGRRGPIAAETPAPAPSGPAVQVGDGPVKVVMSNADQMFLDILECCSTEKMPRYKGDLELINHSAGELTSQTVLKRWNRQAEVLADGAEKAALAAAWLGGPAYPQKRLNDAWTLALGNQFHDTMAGTSSPSAYELAWNDAAIALNQFASVLKQSTATVASAMNTQVKGTPLVVYNPLAIEREDVVEAEIAFAGGTPKAVRVFGPGGKETPAQIENGKVVFVAKVPPAGYAVYDVQAVEKAGASTLKAAGSTIENARYRVTVNSDGDIASIFDKAIGKELLGAPAGLAFQTERPQQFPAWNMDWADQQKPPRAMAKGPARVSIVENGPARVALRVEREAEGSKFAQTIRLAAGDAGNRVEIAMAMDWKTAETALKATFPLSATNPEATYNWDIGTIRRHNNEERQYEVASHQWIDLTDRSGEYGATILTDAKNGSDKPDDGTVRLTLVYTPGVRGGGYSYQASQDWGHHEFVYGIAGHTGDWRKGRTDQQAYRLNAPLAAFQTAKHAGALGATFSILKVSASRVRVLALKKAEEGDEWIVRVVETDGAPVQGVRIGFAGPVTAAREVNGQEQRVGTAVVRGGELVTDLGAYQPRTFAVRLGAAPAKAAATTSAAATLAYDTAVASLQGGKAAPGFDAAGRALAAEMLPREIEYGGVKFRLGPADGKNAMTAKGQSIALPGRFNRVYVLAASADGDRKAAFRVGAKTTDVTVEDWGGFLGQWDDHVYDVKQPQPGPGGPGGMGMMRMGSVYEFKGIKPGFMKRADVAWFASHRHAADGSNEAYEYSYLFAYAIDAPAGARTLTLPNDERIRVLAVTVAEEAAEARPVEPLYDALGER